MKPYIEWTKEELVAEKARLEQEFADVKAKGLNPPSFLSGVSGQSALLVASCFCLGALLSAAAAAALVYVLAVFSCFPHPGAATPRI